MKFISCIIISLFSPTHFLNVCSETSSKSSYSWMSRRAPTVTSNKGKFADNLLICECICECVWIWICEFEFVNVCIASYAFLKSLQINAKFRSSLLSSCSTLQFSYGQGREVLWPALCSHHTSSKLQFRNVFLINVCKQMEIAFVDVAIPSGACGSWAGYRTIYLCPS